MMMPVTSDKKQNCAGDILKKIRVIVCSIVLVAILLTTGLGIYLSDEHLNGFVGMWGCLQLSSKKTAVQVSQNPLQFICSKDSFENNSAMDTICERHSNSNEENFYYQGTASIDGVEYVWTYRAFTSDYCVVRFETAAQ